MYLLIRYGLVAFLATRFAFRVVAHFPVAADLDAWYVGGPLFALGAVAVMGVYGFDTPVAGRPLLADRLARN